MSIWVCLAVASARESWGGNFNSSRCASPSGVLWLGCNACKPHCPTYLFSSPNRIQRAIEGRRRPGLRRTTGHGSPIGSFLRHSAPFL